MKTLFILNDPPYGTERCYNALRLAHTLLKKEPEAEITVFLMADPRHQAIASRLVKEIAALGGDITSFVSPTVAQRVNESFRRLAPQAVNE